MKPWKAIAAMSLNRVIGKDNRLPWHLPEELKWLRKITHGQVIVMGRKTFESMGRPMPDRENIVLTRSDIEIPGVRILRGLDEVEKIKTDKEIWIFGGAEIYRQALPQCSDLYLTVVNLQVEDGDVFFPEFENDFELKEVIRREPEFTINHYVNKRATP